MKSQSKILNKSNSEEKKKETKETKEEVNKKNSIVLHTKPQNPDKFPKNVNEFRHIMDDVNCCRADIEFMLELRRQKKILTKEKQSSIGEPPFYQEDLEKYRTKIYFAKYFLIELVMP